MNIHRIWVIYSILTLWPWIWPFDLDHDLSRSWGHMTKVKSHMIPPQSYKSHKCRLKALYIIQQRWKIRNEGHSHHNNAKQKVSIVFAAHSIHLQKLLHTQQQTTFVHFFGIWSSFKKLILSKKKVWKLRKTFHLDDDLDECQLCKKQQKRKHL